MSFKIEGVNNKLGIEGVPAAFIEHDYFKSINYCREIIVRCCDDEHDCDWNRPPALVAITRKRMNKRGDFANAVKRKATRHKIAVTTSQNIVRKATRNFKPKRDKVHPKKTRLKNVDVEDVIKKFMTRKLNGRGLSSCKDLFDLSNDEFYSKKINSTQFFDNQLDTFVWHAIPAQNLHISLFPPLSDENVQNYHRMPLGNSSNSFVSKNLNRCMSVSIQSHQLHGSSFLGSAKDTLAGDKHLILCEFSEQHPVFIAQPGMHSRMKNLAYRSIKSSKIGQPLNKHDLGEMKFIDENHISPLIGRLKADQILSYLENNMFRAPIYEHNMLQSDFLVRVTPNGFVISPLVKIYCVGQELPLMSVPSPESRRAAILTDELLKFYINRLFAQSVEVPKHLKMSTLRTLVPFSCESKVRKRLRTCSNFKRCKDTDVPGHWLLNQNFRLMGKDALCQLVTPEDYCAYHSMLSAQYRLKMAGYDSQSSDGVNNFNKLLAEELSDREDDSLCDEQEPPQVDVELECAPWNTTKAFLNAVRNQRYFEVIGRTDPTGCGEGFSFARPNNKTKNPKQKREKVTADLRKITLESARNMLLDMGMSEEDVINIPRWQVIDVIRTLSTKQFSNSTLQTENSNFTKYARMTRMDHSVSEYASFIESYQKVFELQNRSLEKDYVDYSCQSDDSADSDIEILNDDVPHSSDFFQKLKLHNIKKDPDEESVDILCMEPDKNPPNTKLIIYRTYEDENGYCYTNSELINDYNLAKLYIKVRVSLKDSSIREIICSEKEYKIDMRRAKRRLQDKLRRIKRKEKLASLGIEVYPRRKFTKPKNPPKPKSENLLKTRCSACLQLGHMKTNKYCPARKKLPVRVGEPSVKRASHLLTAENLRTSVRGLKVNVEKRLPTQKRRSKTSLIESPVVEEKLGDDKLEEENIKTAERLPGVDDGSEMNRSNIFDMFTKTMPNSQEDAEANKPLNPRPSFQSTALNRILSSTIRDLSIKSSRSVTAKFMYAKLAILDKCDKVEYSCMKDFWIDFDQMLAKTVSRSKSNEFRRNLARLVTDDAVDYMARQLESGTQMSAVSEIDNREFNRKVIRDNYIKIEIGDDFDRKF